MIVEAEVDKLLRKQKGNKRTICLIFSQGIRKWSTLHDFKTKTIQDPYSILPFQNQIN